jgi:hypothetical protein
MLSLAALLAAQKENPLNISMLRGFLVAGVGETSNFDLLKDLAKVVEYIDVSI